MLWRLSHLERPQHHSSLCRLRLRASPPSLWQTRYEMDDTSNATASDSNEDASPISTNGENVQTYDGHGRTESLGGFSGVEGTLRGDALKGIGVGGGRNKTVGVARPAMLVWNDMTYR